jgi:hypothetical protein
MPCFRTSHNAKDGFSAYLLIPRPFEYAQDRTAKEYPQFLKLHHLAVRYKPMVSKLTSDDGAV